MLRYSSTTQVSSLSMGYSIYSIPHFILSTIKTPTDHVMYITHTILLITIPFYTKRARASGQLKSLNINSFQIGGTTDAESLNWLAKLSAYLALHKKKFNLITGYLLFYGFL